MCYIKYIIILMTKHIKNPFVISFIFLIFSIVFLSIFFNKISRDNLSEQIQHRQQLATRTGSRSIGSLLRAVGMSTSALADDPSQERLERFISSWGNDGVAGVIVVDKKGIVTYDTNRIDIKDVGMDVSYRDYFIWAKGAKRGEYNVSSPILSKIGETRGKYVITIASPVIDGGIFEGVVVSAVVVSELVEKHLNDIKVLDTSNIHLITSSGEVVYSDYQNISDKSVREIFDIDFLGKRKLIEIFVTELKKDGETKISLVLPNIENNYSLEEYLVTASPINLNGNLWKLIISVPQKDLNVFTYSFFNKQIIAVFLVVSVFIVITLKASRDSGYDQAVKDEHIKHNIV